MKYDVIIVGGGVVGLTAALSLAKFTSLSILLLETRKIDSYQVASSNSRVSAITSLSKQLFMHLGVWDAINCVTGFTKMHVWTKNSDAAINFNASESDVDYLGYIIANANIELALLNELKTLNNVSLKFGVTTNSIEFLADCVQINVDNFEVLTAELLVAADGVNSKLVEWAGINKKITDYNQTAIITTLKTELAHNYTARQCFLKTGPLAFLPLEDMHSNSIVWSVDSGAAKRLLELSDDEFSIELANSFDCELGAIEDVSLRQAFPLLNRQAESYVRNNFVLVGDAAHSIHPLAGQGMNLGIADCICLAETISRSVNSKRAFMTRAALRPYERARKTITTEMMCLMNFFQAVPASKNNIIQSLWRVGLAGIDSMPLAKKYIAKFILGGSQVFPKIVSDN